MDEGKMYACMTRYIFYMCILLCYKRWLVLGNKQVDTTTDTEAFDEQKALQQALFLVELLKSEYARVLQENREIRKGLFWEGSMTCATTKKARIDTAPATPQMRHWPRRIPPISPALRKWRRRYPQIDSNIYYDILARNNEYNEGFEDKENAGEWRRFQYEDAFGPQPGSTNTPRSTETTSPSSIKASSVMTSAPTSIPSTANDNILKVSTSSSVVSTQKTTTSEITASVSKNTIKEPVKSSLKSSSHTTRRIMLLSRKISSTTSSVSNSKEGNKLQSTPVSPVSPTTFSVSNNGTPQNTDLEVSQAAAELEKELGANLGKWKNKITRKIPKIWRASTRVHLAGSTRYQIPFPDNHAFCYTNPYNALCRTFI